MALTLFDSTQGLLAVTVIWKVVRIFQLLYLLLTGFGVVFLSSELVHYIPSGLYFNQVFLETCIRKLSTQ